MSTGSRGNYRKMKRDIESITIEDLNNPWTFYNLFMVDNDTLLKWLMDNGFIASSLICKKPGCDGVCYKAGRNSKVLKHSFRCNVNHNHEFAIRTYSFFEKSHFTVPDTFQFIRSYLEETSLYQA